MININRTTAGEGDDEEEENKKLLIEALNNVISDIYRPSPQVVAETVAKWQTVDSIIEDANGFRDEGFENPYEVMEGLAASYLAHDPVQLQQVRERLRNAKANDPLEKQ